MRNRATGYLSAGMRYRAARHRERKSLTPAPHRFPFSRSALHSHAMTRHISVLLAVFLHALPASAQGERPLTFPLTDILALAELAHLGRTGFSQALSDILPLNIQQTTALDAALDPFLWSLSGSFGTQTASQVPGAIFECARYGLGTREAFAEFGFTAPETFALMRLARPQYNDPETWPDGAVARLHCAFVWDDARVVEIVGADPTRAGLAANFDTLIERPQTDMTRAVYGEDGYRIDATRGLEDSVVQVESARMTLTLGHQSLSFRSFLMGGGA